MKVEEEKFTHSNENSNWLTIVFDPNITSGISKIEVLNIKNLEGLINYYFAIVNEPNKFLFYLMYFLSYNHFSYIK